MTSREGGTGEVAPQAAQRLYTQRDMALAARAAFERGAEWMFSAGDPWGPGGAPAECRAAARRQGAKQAYPLPRVIRPRVVPDPHGMPYRWTCRDGRIRPSVQWDAAQLSELETITPERVALWADLLARPFEEVDAEE